MLKITIKLKPRTPTESRKWTWKAEALREITIKRYCNNIHITKLVSITH